MLPLVIQQNVRLNLPPALWPQTDAAKETMRDALEEWVLRNAKTAIDQAMETRADHEKCVGVSLLGLAANVKRRDKPLTDADFPDAANDMERMVCTKFERRWSCTYVLHIQTQRTVHLPDNPDAEGEAVRRGGKLD